MVSRICLTLFALSLVACGVRGEIDHQQSSSDAASSDGGDAIVDGDAIDDEDVQSNADATADSGEDTRRPPADTGPDNGLPDTEPPIEEVGIFVLQGDFFRTAISCDNGKTWIHDKLNETPMTCYDKTLEMTYECADRQCYDGEEPRVDCDHESGAPKGITYEDGWFFATWGWGQSGGVYRSPDGVNWEKVIDDTTYGGIASGNAAIVTGSKRPEVSTDRGETWTEYDNTVHDTHVRGMAFVDIDGGMFIMAGDGSISMSSDEGKTWSIPGNVPDGCGHRFRGLAGGGGAIVLTGGKGYACTSTDNGQTWSVVAMGGLVDSPNDDKEAEPALRPQTKVFYRDGTFVTWGNGIYLDDNDDIRWMDTKMYTSADGSTWNASELDTPVRLGAVGMNPNDGTLVATRGGWKNWYDKQRFYRSTDGLRWTELDVGDVERSHRVRHIIYGFTTNVEVCDPN
jgi:hypothetical protein